MSSGLVMPKVIQNSTIVYGIGLATVAPLFAWGVGGEFWPAIAFVGFVGLGLSLIYVLRRPLLEFLAGALSHDRSITVHEFIARRHGNDPRVAAVAAALTVFALAGFLVCVMLGVATVLKPLLSDSAGLTELFIAAAFVVVIASTFFAGHTGIMHAAQLQMGLLYLGLFGATACLLYLQVSELGSMPARGTIAIASIPIVGAIIYFRRRVRYVDTDPIRTAAADSAAAVRAKQPLPSRLLSRFQKILNSLIAVLAMTSIVLAIAVVGMEFYIDGMSMVVGDSVAAVEAGLPVSNSPVSNATLISLVLLALLHPVVDIVNWQRLAAFAKYRDWNPPGESQWMAAFRSFCTSYVVEVPLIGLFICLIGAIAGLTMAMPASGHVVDAFIERLIAQDNFMANGVMLFSLFSVFSLAVSTMGSLFCAGLCAIRYDIVPLFSPEPASAAGARGRGEADGAMDDDRGAWDRTRRLPGIPSRQRGISTDVCECRISWDGFRFQFGAAVVCPSCPGAPRRRKRRHWNPWPGVGLRRHDCRQRRRIRHRRDCPRNRTQVVAAFRGAGLSWIGRIAFCNCISFAPADRVGQVKPGRRPPARGQLFKVPSRLALSWPHRGRRRA